MQQPCSCVLASHMLFCICRAQAMATILQQIQSAAHSMLLALTTGSRSTTQAFHPQLPATFTAAPLGVLQQCLGHLLHLHQATACSTKMPTPGTTCQTWSMCQGCTQAMSLPLAHPTSRLCAPTGETHLIRYVGGCGFKFKFGMLVKKGSSFFLYLCKDHGHMLLL
jgi:hypothetical protein